MIVLTPLTISVIAIWLIVLFYGLSIIALARQIGLLHIQINSLRSSGMIGEEQRLKIGDAPAPIVADNTNGTKTVIGGPHDRDRILVFVSPDCGGCDAVMPALIASYGAVHRYRVIVHQREPRSIQGR